jgi:hypothetical protein
MTKQQSMAEVAQEVDRQFAELDAAAAANPGLTELLRAYGGYEAALKQADAYFALLHKTLPSSTSSNTSGL